MISSAESRPPDRVSNPYRLFVLQHSVLVRTVWVSALARKSRRRYLVGILSLGAAASESPKRNLSSHHQSASFAVFCLHVRVHEGRHKARVLPIHQPSLPPSEHCCSFRSGDLWLVRNWLPPRYRDVPACWSTLAASGFGRGTSILASTLSDHVVLRETCKATLKHMGHGFRGLYRTASENSSLGAGSASKEGLIT